MPAPDVVYIVARDSLIVDINEALNFIQQFTLDTFVARISDLADVVSSMNTLIDNLKKVP